MHELGIATNIVEIVEHEMKSRGYRQVSVIALKIGAMTDVDHEALRFGFEVITKESPLAGARLEIESVPIKIKCETCGKTSEVEQFHFACQTCGSSKVTLLQGTELDIAYLEIEEEGSEMPALPSSMKENI